MSEEIQQQETTQEQPAAISLADLTIAVQAIQIGAQRGAFRAEEFTSIGSAFERLVTFLEANGAIKRNQPTTEETPADEA